MQNMYKKTNKYIFSQRNMHLKNIFFSVNNWAHCPRLIIGVTVSHYDDLQDAEVIIYPIEHAHNPFLNHCDMPVMRNILTIQPLHSHTFWNAISTLRIQTISSEIRTHFANLFALIIVTAPNTLKFPLNKYGNINTAKTNKEKIQNF